MSKRVINRRPGPFNLPNKVVYCWFAWVKLHKDKPRAWYRTCFEENSKKGAMKWKTHPMASDVFVLPTKLVKITTSMHPVE